MRLFDAVDSLVRRHQVLIPLESEDFEASEQGRQIGLSEAQPRRRVVTVGSPDVNFNAKENCVRSVREKMEVARVGSCVDSFPQVKDGECSKAAFVLGCAPLSEIPCVLKYYAVQRDRIRGIFFIWDECERSFKGYSGAKFKSFLSYQEAVNYLNAGG